MENIPGNLEKTVRGQLLVAILVYPSKRLQQKRIKCVELSWTTEDETIAFLYDSKYEMHKFAGCNEGRF